MLNYPTKPLNFQGYFAIITPYLITMKPYELTYIITSGITSEQAGEVIKEVETFIQNRGGIIVKSEKTLPQTLAYPIKKHSSGYFAILEFQADEKEIKGLKEKLEKDEKILRHFLIIKKPVKKMKERRTRKPIFSVEKDSVEKSIFVHPKEAKKEKEGPIEDIGKKIDEILSE